MVIEEIVLKDKSGLQSKKAAVFIQKASNFESKIWIEKDERKANAKSLLGLLSLGISAGSKVSLMAEGEDEKKAVKELTQYLMSSTADKSLNQS